MRINCSKEQKNQGGTREEREKNDYEVTLNSTDIIFPTYQMRITLYSQIWYKD